MARGIIGWIGLAGTLAIAVPIGFMGVDMLVAGKDLGYVFVGLAIAAVAVEEYAARPTDLPGRIAGKAVGGVAKTPEEED